MIRKKLYVLLGILLFAVVAAHADITKKSIKEKTKLEKSVIKVLLPPNPEQQGEDALHIELKLKLK